MDAEMQLVHRIRQFPIGGIIYFGVVSILNAVQSCRLIKLMLVIAECGVKSIIPVLRPVLRLANTFAIGLLDKVEEYCPWTMIAPNELWANGSEYYKRSQIKKSIDGMNSVIAYFLIMTQDLLGKVWRPVRWIKQRVSSRPDNIAQLATDLGGLKSACRATGQRVEQLGSRIEQLERKTKRNVNEIKNAVNALTAAVQAATAGGHQLHRLDESPETSSLSSGPEFVEAKRKSYHALAIRLLQEQEKKGRRRKRRK